jgi:foldase protein PrsA
VPDSVSAVIAPRSRSALARVGTLLAAAVAVSGCATFTDNDVVATVAAQELTADEFAELAGADGDADIDRVGRGQIEEILSLYIIEGLISRDLEALDAGVEAPEPPDGTPAFEALQARYGAALQSYLAIPAEELADAEVRDTYAAGPEASGVACAAHVLVDTRREAESVRAALQAGESFADVAAEQSIDEQSAVRGGQLGCLGVDQFRFQFIPEFVDAALDLEVGEVSAPVESQFGWHVIRIIPLDELDPQERGTVIQSVRFTTLPDRYGVSVDPRYGEWLDVGRLIPVS